MPRITEDMIHPELRGRVRLKNGIEKYSLTKTKIMKMLCKLLRGKHSKDMSYSQEYIMRPDGTKLRICVYTPLERKENVSGLLWIHGGGYAIGMPEQDDAYILDFVKASSCVVVSPDYTLSLDKPYPAAFDDCYATLLWLRDNGEKYGMRSDQIFVGGNSAGGGLAAATTLCARDKKEVAVAFQMLLYPMLDDRPTDSSTDNNDPVWSSVANVESWKLYLRKLYGGDSVPVYAAPAREENLSGLPPTFGYVGSLDPFKDESAAYFDSLKKCGVHVDFKVYEGCFHAFDQLHRDTNISKDAIAFFMEKFKFAVENHFA